MIERAYWVSWRVLQADFDVDVTLGEGLAGGAVGTFLTTLIVGGILVAVLPAYTERMMETVLEEPVDSFVYGVASLVFVALAVLVLVFTVVGVIVAIPLIVLTYLVWAVGSAIAFLAIGDRLVDRGDGWLKPLVVAAAMNGGLALTGVGVLVAFVVGAVGFGAVLQDRYG